MKTILVIIGILLLPMTLVVICIKDMQADLKNENELIKKYVL